MTYARKQRAKARRADRAGYAQVAFMRRSAKVRTEREGPSGAPMVPRDDGGRRFQGRPRDAALRPLAAGEPMRLQIARRLAALSAWRHARAVRRYAEALRKAAHALDAEAVRQGFSRQQRREMFRKAAAGSDTLAAVFGKVRT